PVCLAFGADRQAMNDLFRFKTMATRHVIPLLPLFADWKGTGTPVINFVSRNGQIMSVSLYDSGSNYNCCIAAQSGSGKSFLVNEIISSYLSEGGQCWVIDVGRSYEKLCEVYDGEFLQFGR
ncbi:sex pilus assembly protein, partial [Pasteurella multocida subsp. multocida str. Anand1_buffalo]